MLWVIVLNAATLLLSIGLVQGIVPVSFLGSFIRGLHAIIGITTPTEKQVRWALVAWFVSTALLLDLLLYLLVYVF